MPLGLGFEGGVRFGVSPLLQCRASVLSESAGHRSSRHEVSGGKLLLFLLLLTCHIGRWLLVRSAAVFMFL